MTAAAERKTTLVSGDAYTVHYCPIHKRHIHVLKSKEADGACWDCLRDAGFFRVGAPASERRSA